MYIKPELIIHKCITSWNQQKRCGGIDSMELLITNIASNLRGLHCKIWKTSMSNVCDWLSYNTHLHNIDKKYDSKD